jgi:hypothetical protein
VGSKRQRIIAIILLFLVALNALAAGYGFMADPSGRGLGMTTDYIQHSPFNSFLIPGIVLFIVNGICSMITAVIAIRQGRHYQDLIFAQGAVLTGWIVIQVLMVRDFNRMHATCLLIGYLLTRFGRQLKLTVPQS